MLLQLFPLEEMRDKRVDHFARVIQKAFQRHFNRQKFLRQKEQAADILYKHKQRRRHSLNRNFFSDYIGMEDNPKLKALVGRREKVEFAQTIKMFDRGYRGLKEYTRDLVVTAQAVFLIGRTVVSKGLDKGQVVETVNHRFLIKDIAKVSMSPLQDDLVVIHVLCSTDHLLMVPFKTEFVTTLKKLRKARQTNLNINFASS